MLKLKIKSQFKRSIEKQNQNQNKLVNITVINQKSIKKLN